MWLLRLASGQMQKTLTKNNVKKDASLILCVIYFCYLIFKIFIHNRRVLTSGVKLRAKDVVLAGKPEPKKEG